MIILIYILIYYFIERVGSYCFVYQFYLLKEAMVGDYIYVFMERGRGRRILRGYREGRVLTEKLGRIGEFKNSTKYFIHNVCASLFYSLGVLGMEGWEDFWMDSWG